MTFLCAGSFFNDVSSLVRPKPFSVDTEMLLDCAVIALVCSWKTDPRAVSKIYRNGIFGGKRDEEAEVPLEDFKKTLFNVRNLYRSLIRQLVRLAFDDVTAKVRSNCLFVYRFMSSRCYFFKSHWMQKTCSAFLLIGPA